MILWLAMAWGVEFTVVPATEGLHPLIPERVWLAITEEGEPSPRPPVVHAQGGRVRFGREEGGEGIWPLVITPDLDAEQVVLEIEALGRKHTATLEVGWPAPVPITLAPRTDTIAQSGPVRLLLSGDDLPSPDDLAITISEGEVLAVEQVGEGLQVKIALDDSPVARVVMVGVRDRRSTDRPVWGNIRVRARPRVPLEAEPGASVHLVVGGRTYGPFVADPEGRISARVDQYPGESRVTATLVDDLGNVAVSTFPMAITDRPAMLIMEGPRRAAERAPGVVWLRANQPAGRPWKGAAPTCRSPASGALTVTSVAPGLYAVPLDGRVRTEQANRRIECRLGEASVSTRVGPLPMVPAKVLLHVWPTELSTDLPVAEVRVAVEDTEGRRLPVEGIELTADHGQLRSIEYLRERATAEYDGQDAVNGGVDRILATYHHPTSNRPVHSLQLEWEPTRTGWLSVSVTARDARGRPVENAAITVGAGDQTSRASTDAHGNAQVRVAVPAGNSPVVLVGMSEHAIVRGIVLRSGTERYSIDGRGVFEPLVAERELSLSPGRVSGISIAFEPPILRTGRNSVAYVTVALEDRSGRPVIDEDVRLKVSEGTIGPLIPRPDGTLVAEFQPESNDRAREVVVVATTESLRSSARLDLEPRLGRLSIGPTFGWVSNLGAINAPVLGFDADLRTNLLAETVLIRASVNGYAVSSSASTGIGADVSITGSVVPGLLAVLLRQDRAGFGFWGGGGGALAVHPTTVRFGPDIVSQGTRVLTGGGVLTGVGYRLGPGDIAAEARWMVLPGPGGDVGFTGNLGGLSASVGYRLVY